MGLARPFLPGGQIFSWVRAIVETNNPNSRDTTMKIHESTEVVEILKEGSAVAEKTAAATLANVRKAMRIDYFADNNLLK